VSRLTQKERMLLQDQLSHEQICITKYSGYAARAKDPELKKLFYEFAADEQQHYDTINSLLQGTGQSQTQTQYQSRGQGQGQFQGQSQVGMQQSGTQHFVAGQSGSQQGGMQHQYTAQATGHQAPPQAGAWQSTGGQGAAAGQNWMSESRTIYGGQISQGNQQAAQQGTQQGTQQGMQHGAQQGAQHAMATSDDKSMCEDMLMTEKYISGTYDTAVFEATNPQVRQALQHIQKDEQTHGERIFKYMQQKGMYQPQ